MCSPNSKGRRSSGESSRDILSGFSWAFVMSFSRLCKGTLTLWFAMTIERFQLLRDGCSRCKAKQNKSKGGWINPRAKRERKRWSIYSGQNFWERNLIRVATQYKLFGSSPAKWHGTYEYSTSSWWGLRKNTRKARTLQHSPWQGALQEKEVCMALTRKTISNAMITASKEKDSAWHVEVLKKRKIRRRRASLKVLS